MFLKSQFPDWLELASRDGRGGYSAELPSFVRGSPYSVKFNLTDHEVFGDWTEGSFSAELRAAPDAGGAAAATFTVSVGTPSGLVTPVTLTLPVAAQSGIPADGNADGLVELLFQLDFTPTEGAANAIVQSNVFIAGTV